MAICAFQFSIPQLMILIVESFHVKDGTLRKMLGKVIKNIIFSHIPYPLESGIDIGTDSNSETGAYDRWYEVPCKSQNPTVLG